MKAHRERRQEGACVQEEKPGIGRSKIACPLQALPRQGHGAELWQSPRHDPEEKVGGPVPRPCSESTHPRQRPPSSLTSKRAVRRGAWASPKEGHPCLQQALQGHCPGHAASCGLWPASHAPFSLLSLRHLPQGESGPGQRLEQEQKAAGPQAGRKADQ